MKDRLRGIDTIPFLVCLSLLLLNDFYLKIEYHNWLTGKLSDFCGLFVFALFWTALFPGKKLAVHVATAVLFLVWKSPYSQWFIDLFSENVYTIHRVVDRSDLIALLSLPLAFFHEPKHVIQWKMDPVPLALLSLFAFCATSVPKFHQKFEQPQYILYKSGIVHFKNSDSFNKYQVYQLDSFLILDVREVQLYREPVLQDEFNKKQELKVLESTLLKELYERTGDPKAADFKSLMKALRVVGRNSIILKLDSAIDELDFQDTRLDGYFKRSDNGQTLIEGRYRNGIEDSIWTWYDRSGKVLSKKYFENGELAKIEQFENSTLMASKTLDVRADVIRTKNIQLIVIGVLLVLMAAKLVFNYRRSDAKDIIQLSHFSRIAGIVLLPIGICILSNLISLYMPYAYSAGFGIFGEVFLIYVTTAVLFALIFYVMKLRSVFDLVFYILLFSLSVVFVEE